MGPISTAPVAVCEVACLHNRRITVLNYVESAAPSDSRRPVVCVAHRFPLKYSETFIRAHLERLPARVVELTGKSFDPLKLRCFLSEQRVAAVLAEYGLTGVAVMEGCQAAGIPLVVHFHGYDAYKQTILERRGQSYPELFEISAAIVAVSRDMERQLLDLGAPREKLLLNPCGVDHSFFRGADAERAPPTFLAVGRFVDKKAPHLTVLAFSKVSARHPSARLVMIGEGQLLEASRQLTRSLGIGRQVEFRGMRPHEEVAAAMRETRAFVQHSVRTSDGDSEGTPVSVLEAGAAGLPVVATRHAGIQDAVLHEETGFLVDEGDIDGMARRMEQLLEDPALAGRLGKAASRRMRAEYSLDNKIGALWSIIERAIKDSALRD